MAVSMPSREPQRRLKTIGSESAFCSGKGMSQQVEGSESAEETSR